LLQIKLNSAGNKVESVNTFYKNKYGRMRDVAISPDGKIFIITSNGSNDKLIVVSGK